ncbi:UNVERIFIED_CONTAM: hypothetical protein K2H54_065482 [Gekko kuhli]
MGTTITTTVASGSVDVFSQKRPCQYNHVHPVESGREYGEYSGRGKEQLQNVKQQLQAQQDEMWREMQEMMLDLPRLITMMVQHELRLQYPAGPAALPAGQEPSAPVPLGQQPVPAGPAALARSPA